MLCNKPYYQGDASFPCGQCIACKMNKSAEWAIRVCHELFYWDNAVFLTLTYDNDHLPIEISKRELQLFIKRVRKDKDIKYYACGEYGDQTYRPHYHLILFGMSRKDFDQIGYSYGKLLYSTKYWTKGNIFIGNVTYNSARYVAKYIYKKYNGKYAKEYYGTLQKPFQLVSQGIGLRWCLDNVQRILDYGYINANGSKRSVPRYYIKKLEDIYTLEIDRYKREKKDYARIESILARLDLIKQGLTKDEVESRFAAKRKEREKTLARKLALSREKKYGIPFVS